MRSLHGRFCAKALGNGHPIAAVIGTKAAMEGAHKSFISSTYWTEGVGPVAAIACIDKMERVKAWEIADFAGGEVARAWRELGEKHKLPVQAGGGYNCLAHFAFTEHTNELKTLYTVLMLKKGFLANTAIYPTVAHTQSILEMYYTAMDEVFSDIADIIKKGIIVESIGGEPAHTGFKRLN
jgi:glutamate-1-semialdehyde 2,1-aminomutase